MEGGIIQDHHRLRGQHRQELLFQPGIEHLGIAGSLIEHRSDKFTVKVTADQARALARIAIGIAHDSLATPRPGITAFGA